MDKKKWFQFLFGLALGLLFLWWSFHGTDWAAVWTSMSQVNLGWVLVNQLIVWVTFVTRIQRWGYIVRAGGPASFRSMFSATQIGFLANFTLPARLGEAVRALVLTRLTRIPFSKSFAMVALDRVTDVIGLIAVMLVAAVSFRPTHDIILPPSIYAKPIPANLIRTATGGAMGFLIVLISVLVLLYVNQRLMLRVSDKVLGGVSKRFAERVHGVLEQFAAGLHVFRSPSDMAKSIFFSLVTWVLFLLINVTFFEAFGIHSWPWYTPFVLTTLISIAVSIPGAPGFIGQFHFALIVSVSVLLPDVNIADAKAMAILAHLLNLIPIGIAGIYCLMHEDLRLLELARAQTHPDEPAVP